MKNRCVGPGFAFLATVLITCSLHAQVDAVNDQTSTPLPGTDHSYIGALAETVNPANGSVSLRLPVAPPRGRDSLVPSRSLTIRMAPISLPAALLVMRPGTQSRLIYHRGAGHIRFRCSPLLWGHSHLERLRVSITADMFSKTRLRQGISLSSWSMRLRDAQVAVPRIL